MQFVVTFICFFVLIAIVLFVIGLVGTSFLRMIIHEEWPFVPDNKAIGKKNFLDYRVIKVQGDDKFVKKALRVHERFKGAIDYPSQCVVYAIASPTGKIARFDVGRYSWKYGNSTNEFYHFLRDNKITYHLGYEADGYHYVVAYDKEEDAVKVLEWLREKYHESIIYKTCEDTRNKVEIVY